MRFHRKVIRGLHRPFGDTGSEGLRLDQGTIERALSSRAMREFPGTEAPIDCRRVAVRPTQPARVVEIGRPPGDDTRHGTDYGFGSPVRRSGEEWPTPSFI
jgi:hypothetical protein